MRKKLPDLIPKKNSPEGIFLVNKASHSTSFTLVKLLRSITKIKKIGHAGTLDPLATGLMILLIGSKYTKLSQKFILFDKSYYAIITLGKETDSYDAEGKVVKTCSQKPSCEEIEKAICYFQGEVDQVPPMYSAKKIRGKKLYELARKGITIERKVKKISLSTELLSYNYPFVEVSITCSSGTYIRSVAHDLGQILQCGAFLSSLKRTRIGPFYLSNAIEEEKLRKSDFSYENHLLFETAFES